jgi:hypothetical protein
MMRVTSAPARVVRTDGRERIAGMAWVPATPAAGEQASTSQTIDEDGTVQPAPDDPAIADKLPHRGSTGQITRRVRIP